jgi:CheY-like chemotaxis protein
MTARLKEPACAEGTDLAYRPSPRQPGILVAGDMDLMLTLLKGQLQAHGFKVWLAVDGDDAIDLYKCYHAEIDLVVLNVLMPCLDGPQTLTHLQCFNPNVIACFIMENGGRYTEEELVERGAAMIFSKRFKPIDIAGLLKRMASSSEYVLWRR